MEVDLNPSASPSGSRHASPFHHATALAVASGSGGGNGGGGNGGGSTRKRRRDFQQAFAFDSAQGVTEWEGYTSPSSSRAAYDDDDSRQSKRRSQMMTTASEAKQDVSDIHYFRALGAAATGEDEEVELDRQSLFANDVGGAQSTEASEYGMDSPMHSLRLISRSPSVENDVEMGAENDASSESVLKDQQHGHHDQLTASSSTAIAFVPRQLRVHPLRSIVHAPTRPSPLARQAEELASSTDSSPYQRRSMDRSASSSSSSQDSLVHTTRRRATGLLDAADARMQMTLVDQPAALPRRVSHDEAVANNAPLRRASRSDRAYRTPSPRPQFNQSSGSGDNESDEADSLGRASLHPSPGMSQSTFPGGKQMLRYTMGFRDDCEMCRNKVAGHYGHVVHRAL